MKKIAFILDAFGFFGGPERRAYRLACGLKQKAYDVSIISIMKMDSEVVRKAKENGIKVYGVTQEGNKSLKSYRLDVFLKLRKILSNLKPDMVFTFEFLADYTSKMALLGKNVPIFTFIGSTVWKWERKWHRRVAMEYFVKRSVLYIVNSQTVRVNLVRVLPETEDKVKLLYNPVDTEYFKPVPENVRLSMRKKFNLSESAFVVGSVVRFYNPKGADVLIDAFYRSKIDAVLFLIGDGSLRNKLKKMVESFSIQDKVIFAGAFEATPEIYSIFDISVVPSQKGGFDNVVVESLACGLPTVATEATGIGEIAKNNEHLVITDIDAEGVSRGICHLYFDPRKRELLSRKGREFVIENLRVEKITGLLLKWMSV